MAKNSILTNLINTMSTKGAWNDVAEDLAKSSRNTVKDIRMAEGDATKKQIAALQRLGLSNDDAVSALKNLKGEGGKGVDEKTKNDILNEAKSKIYGDNFDTEKGQFIDDFDRDTYDAKIDAAAKQTYNADTAKQAKQNLKGLNSDLNRDSISNGMKDRFNMLKKYYGGYDIANGKMTDDRLKTIAVRGGVTAAGAVGATMAVDGIGSLISGHSSSDSDSE